jgi:UDP-N-acetylglucosamine--N-acetylmuramyl-(pentapeptide) pyrophosphoryl-undecaprenol N-acetylglucosamine transferase
VRPGLANRVGARMTDRIATGSPDCRLAGGRYIGMPLRRALATLDRPALRAEACDTFGLDKDRTTLLVYGGSLGARRLNESVLAAAPAFAAAGIQVLHAVGRANYDESALPGARQDASDGAAGDQGADGAAERGKGTDDAPYVAVPYLDRMDLAYAAADLVLCRGGAMTCAEVAAVGLPAAYVPLPIGNGEQRLNAQSVVRAGGGLLVDDADLTAQWLTQELIPLALDRQRLEQMGLAAAEFGRRDADEALADLVFEAAGSTPALAAGAPRPGSAGVGG